MSSVFDFFSRKSRQAHQRRSEPVTLVFHSSRTPIQVLQNALNLIFPLKNYEIEEPGALEDRIHVYVNGEISEEQKRKLSEFEAAQLRQGM